MIRSALPQSTTQLAPSQARGALSKATVTSGLGSWRVWGIICQCIRVVFDRLVEFRRYLSQRLVSCDAYVNSRREGVSGELHVGAAAVVALHVVAVGVAVGVVWVECGIGVLICACVVCTARQSQEDAIRLVVLSSLVAQWLCCEGEGGNVFTQACATCSPRCNICSGLVQA